MLIREGWLGEFRQKGTPGSINGWTQAQRSQRAKSIHRAGNWNPGSL